MNKTYRAARLLPIIAIFSLLLIAMMVLGMGNNGRISLGREKLAETTPVHASNLLWVSPGGNGTADVAEWEQNPIYVDTGAWAICVSGGSISSVSWRETPDSIVITISGTLPDGNDEPARAPTY